MLTFYPNTHEYVLYCFSSSTSSLTSSHMHVLFTSINCCNLKNSGQNSVPALASQNHLLQAPNHKQIPIPNSKEVNKMLSCNDKSRGFFTYECVLWCTRVQSSRSHVPPLTGLDSIIWCWCPFFIYYYYAYTTPTIWAILVHFLVLFGAFLV